MTKFDDRSFLDKLAEDAEARAASDAERKEARELTRRAQSRSHPIRQLLDQAARGHVDERGIADLRLPDAKAALLRRELTEQANEVAAFRAEGSLKAARDLARDYAAGHIESLGNWEPEPAAPVPTDPAELAALIDRW